MMARLSVLGEGGSDPLRTSRDAEDMALELLNIAAALADELGAMKRRLIRLERLMAAQQEWDVP